MDLFRYLVLGALLTTGCGGSSNDSSSNSEAGGSRSEPVKAVYAGKTAALTITEENALDVASTVIFARDTISFAENLWLDMPGYHEISTSGEPQTISGGTGSATARAERVAGGTAVTVEYDDYSANNVRLSGATVQTILLQERDAVLPGFTPMKGNTEFIDFHVVAPHVDFVIDGTIKADSRHLSAFAADLVVDDRKAGITVRLSNYRIEFDRVAKEEGEVVETSMSGDIYVSDHGKISLATVVPLVEFQFKESLGLWIGSAQGRLSLTGANTSLRFASVSEVDAAVLWDRDQDGYDETGLRVPWSFLNGIGDFTSTDAVHEPIANGGASREVLVGEPAVLQGLFSHDQDNEPLEHEWRVLLTPPHSTLPLEPVRAASFEFIPDVKGDYVFQLLVSDGIHTRATTAQVTAVPEPGFPWRPKPILGAIEVSGGMGESYYKLDSGSFGLRLNPDEDRVSWWLEDFDPFEDDVVLGEQEETSATLTPDPLLDLFVEVSYNTRREDVHLGFNTSDIGFDVDATVSHPDSISTRNIVAGDLDGDGYGDLVLVVYDGAGAVMAIWKGLGNGRYTRTQWPIGGGATIAMRDVNSDERPDIVTSDDFNVYIYFQDESGGFPDELVLAAPSGGCADSFDPIDGIGFGDFDGDGQDDILAFRNCTIAIWEQKAGQLDSAITVSLEPDKDGGAAKFGDINNDGLLDAVVLDGAKAKILLNGGSSFSLIRTFESQNSNIINIMLGEFSGDGFLDLVHVDGRNLFFYTGDGDGGFTLWRETSCRRCYQSSDEVFSDLDADGDIDIVAESSGRLYIIENTATGFRVVQLKPAYVTTGAIAIADYNVDGHSDLIVPGEALQVYLGGVRPFSRPWPAVDK